MSFSPEDSAIKMNRTLEGKVFNAKTHYEVSEILRQAAVDQALAVPDRFDPTVLLPVDRPASETPHAFAKSVTVDGQRHIFEGETEAQASQKLLEFVRQQANETPSTERPRDFESGRFTARTDDPVASADLELRFKRGEIDTVTYLAESGAIERHLQHLGVSVESLKAATNERYTTSWQAATESFLKTSDWPGGDENLRIAAQLIKDNGLDDKPSAETLASVYAYMKENGLLKENPVTAALIKIGAATTPEELRAAAQASQGRGSSIFSR